MGCGSSKSASTSGREGRRNVQFDGSGREVLSFPRTWEFEVHHAYRLSGLCDSEDVYRVAPCLEEVVDREIKDSLLYAKSARPQVDGRRRPKTREAVGLVMGTTWDVHEKSRERRQEVAGKAKAKKTDSNTSTATVETIMSHKINQFGDTEDVSNMTVDDWDKRWGLGQTQFHMPKVHPMLEKHYNLLVEGGGKKRIYLPLCGKSVDLKWLASQGHTVVGSEGADLGCQQFFQENDIEFKVTKLSNIDGALYEATNGLDIKIYRCDFFKLKSDTLGEFDCIWDRGSFVAIPLHCRKEYADVIVPCLKKDGKYLLDCFLLDNSMFAGPPFNCTEENVKEIFEGKCNVRKLDERDAITKWQEEGWGIKSFIEQVYLLSRMQ